jgi:hypothetical protein
MTGGKSGGISGVEIAHWPEGRDGIGFDEGVVWHRGLCPFRGRCGQFGLFRGFGQRAVTNGPQAGTVSKHIFIAEKKNWLFEHEYLRLFFWRSDGSRYPIVKRHPRNGRKPLQHVLVLYVATV